MGSSSPCDMPGSERTQFAHVPVFHLPGQFAVFAPAINTDVYPFWRPAHSVIWLSSGGVPDADLLVRPHESEPGWVGHCSADSTSFGSSLPSSQPVFAVFGTSLHNDCQSFGRLEGLCSRFSFAEKEKRS